MLKKNCHLVFGSQKSKPTLLELVFQTAGAINPSPISNRVNSSLYFLMSQSALSNISDE